LQGNCVLYPVDDLQGEPRTASDVVDAFRQIMIAAKDLKESADDESRKHNVPLVSRPMPGAGESKQRASAQQPAQTQAQAVQQKVQQQPMQQEMPAQQIPLQQQQQQQQQRQPKQNAKGANDEEEEHSSSVVRDQLQAPAGLENSAAATAVQRRQQEQQQEKLQSYNGVNPAQLTYLLQQQQQQNTNNAKPPLPRVRTSLDQQQQKSQPPQMSLPSLLQQQPTNGSNPSLLQLHNQWQMSPMYTRSDPSALLDPSLAAAAAAGIAAGAPGGNGGSAHGNLARGMMTPSDDFLNLDSVADRLQQDSLLQHLSIGGNGGNGGGLVNIGRPRNQQEQQQEQGGQQQQQQRNGNNKRQKRSIGIPEARSKADSLLAVTFGKRHALGLCERDYRCSRLIGHSGRCKLSEDPIAALREAEATAAAAAGAGGGAAAAGGSGGGDGQQKRRGRLPGRPPGSGGTTGATNQRGTKKKPMCMCGNQVNVLPAPIQPALMSTRAPHVASIGKRKQLLRLL